MSALLIGAFWSLNLSHVRTWVGIFTVLADIRTLVSRTLARGYKELKELKKSEIFMLIYARMKILGVKRIRIQ